MSRKKSFKSYISISESLYALTEDEYNYLSERIGKINQVTVPEQKELLVIYNRVFKDNRELTSCSSCFLNGVWKKLERVFKEYS